MLQINDKAPHFKLLNADGVEVTLNDFGQKNIIIYFYPKDNTSGCTLEASEFSALLGEFAKKNTVVIGISPDSPKTHKGFIQKQNLKHILLSDPDRSVARAYGAYGKKMMYGKEVMGIIRSTFVVQNGVVKKVFYNIKAKGHAQNVLDSLD